MGREAFRLVRLLRTLAGPLPAHQTFLRQLRQDLLHIVQRGFGQAEHAADERRDPRGILLPGTRFEDQGGGVVQVVDAVAIRLVDNEAVAGFFDVQVCGSDGEGALNAWWAQRGKYPIRPQKGGQLAPRRNLVPAKTAAR